MVVSEYAALSDLRIIPTCRGGRKRCLKFDNPRAVPRKNCPGEESSEKGLSPDFYKESTGGELRGKWVGGS